MNSVIGGDLLDRLAGADRLHGDSGLELGAMGAAFAHLVGAPIRGGTPPQKLTMGAVQKNQTASHAEVNYGWRLSRTELRQAIANNCKLANQTSEL
jgi:hypothetical protein